MSLGSLSGSNIENVLSKPLSGKRYCRFSLNLWLNLSLLTTNPWCWAWLSDIFAVEFFTEFSRYLTCKLPGVCLKLSKAEIVTCTPFETAVKSTHCLWNILLSCGCQKLKGSDNLKNAFSNGLLSLSLMRCDISGFRLCKIVCTAPSKANLVWKTWWNLFVGALKDHSGNSLSCTVCSPVTASNAPCLSNYHCSHNSGLLALHTM